MEKEIELIHEIIANAVIHGGDWGGTYDSNIESLVLAINNWLREKGVRDKYHVIERSYVHTLTYNLKYLRPGFDTNATGIKDETGSFIVPQIVPIEVKQERERIWGDLDLIP